MPGRKSKGVSKSGSGKKPKQTSDKPAAYRTLAVRAETHALLKSLSKSMSTPMATTVAVLVSGWEFVPEDDRRDLLGLPPLVTGPDGEKLGSWLSKALAE